MKPMRAFATLATITALGCCGLALADAVVEPGAGTAGVVQTTARLGQFCSRGQLRFLPDQELPVSLNAKAWADLRRLVVRYSDEYATVTIVPPQSSDRQVPALLNEITGLVVNTVECPDNARTIPANVAVEGLDIVERDGAPDFRIAP